jgi:hypothetical protein
MRRHRNAEFKERFDRLWAALALCEARTAGEITPGIISGIIGCSESYARRLLFERISFALRRKRVKYR